MLNVFLVGIGGMVGSMLRYGVSMLPMECGDGFPIKTLLTNIVGCFLIGIIVMLSGKYSKLSPEMTLMLKTGVCGGFTTFSTFALESETLIQKGDILSGLLYIVFSVAGGMLAVVLTQFL